MNFFTGIYNILYLYLSSTILRDTYFSMTDSAKHVSSLPASAKHVSSLPTLFRTLDYIWCKQHLYCLAVSLKWPSNCFLLFHVMIAFRFVFILSFWHYVCGFNIHLKIIHITQYCSSFGSQFLSDLELPLAKSFLPLTSRFLDMPKFSAI